MALASGEVVCGVAVIVGLQRVGRCLDVFMGVQGSQMARVVLGLAMGKMAVVT